MEVEKLAGREEELQIYVRSTYLSKNATKKRANKFRAKNVNGKSAVGTKWLIRYEAQPQSHLY